MDQTRTYRFEIRGIAPDPLSMARLAEYLTDLSALLGSPEKVHFERLDPDAVPAIQERLHLLQHGQPPEDASHAFTNLIGKLAQDRATASLFTPEPGEFLLFRRGAADGGAAFPSITQTGTIEGILICVGGTGDSVSVCLTEGGHSYRCETSRELARGLACHLFGPVLRVRGIGTWVREPSGQWTASHFHIEGFELLDEASLPRVIQDLREVPGSGWRSVADPLEELRKLRQGSKSMEKAG